MIDLRYEGNFTKYGEGIIFRKKINLDEKTIKIIEEAKFDEATFKELTKDTYQQIENSKSLLQLLKLLEVLLMVKLLHLLDHLIL